MNYNIKEISVKNNLKIRKITPHPESIIVKESDATKQLSSYKIPRISHVSKKPKIKRRLSSVIIKVSKAAKHEIDSKNPHKSHEKAKEVSPVISLAAHSDDITQNEDILELSDDKFDLYADSILNEGINNDKNYSLAFYSKNIMISEGWIIDGKRLKTNYRKKRFFQKSRGAA